MASSIPRAKTTRPGQSLAEALLQDVQFHFAVRSRLNACGVAYLMLCEIGLDGFGSLGQAIFKESLRCPWLNMVAINDHALDAEQIATILREPGFLPKTSVVQVLPASSGRGLNSLLLQDDSFSQRIAVSNAGRSKQVPWASFGRIHHVVDCEAKTAGEAKTRHLHETGAKKVLLARMDQADGPSFRPGSVDASSKYRVQCAVFAVRHPMLWTPKAMAYHFLTGESDKIAQQAVLAVDLLVDVLSRDAVGACHEWSLFYDGRNDPNAPWAEQYEQCLSDFLSISCTQVEKPASVGQANKDYPVAYVPRQNMRPNEQLYAIQFQRMRGLLSP